MAAINPDVVYTSISAYGPTGRRRDRLGYDAAVAAHLGIMSSGVAAGRARSSSAIRAIDYATAFLASIGTLAACAAGSSLALGDHVDVSLLDGALALYHDELVRDRAGKVDRPEER